MIVPKAATGLERACALCCDDQPDQGQIDAFRWGACGDHLGMRERAAWEILGELEKPILGVVLLQNILAE